MLYCNAINIIGLFVGRSCGHHDTRIEMRAVLLHRQGHYRSWRYKGTTVHGRHRHSSAAVQLQFGCYAVAVASALMSVSRTRT
jgi:hypothetical protein